MPRAISRYPYLIPRRRRDPVIAAALDVMKTELAADIARLKLDMLAPRPPGHRPPLPAPRWNEAVVERSRVGIVRQFPGDPELDRHQRKVDAAWDALTRR